MYAIIQLNGKQYKVIQGETLKVDRLDTEAGETLKITDVLLIGTDKETTIGTPLVEKATVTLKVIDNLKDKKIRVATYKAKSRYRKVKGHRQPISMVEVTEIKA